MSQLDLRAQLRRARPVAPTELRERVRLVADRAPQPRRRLTWRLGAVLAFAAALAVVAAVVATRGGDDRTAAVETPPVADTSIASGRRELGPIASEPATAAPTLAPAVTAAPRTAVAPGAAVAPSTTRLQRYRASLELRVA